MGQLTLQCGADFSSIYPFSPQSLVLSNILSSHFPPFIHGITKNYTSEKRMLHKVTHNFLTHFVDKTSHNPFPPVPQIMISDLSFRNISQRVCAIHHLSIRLITVILSRPGGSQGLLYKQRFK